MNKAFSLIELMVVIAIIALLAAIAVPAYQSYGRTAKVGAIMPIVENVVGQVREYYNVNGAYPEASDLGYTTTGGNIIVQNPSAISPELTFLQIDDIGTTCGGSFGNVAFAFDADYVGIGGVNDYTLIYYVFEEDAGVLTTTCIEGNTGGEFNYGYADCMDTTMATYQTFLNANACL